MHGINSTYIFPSRIKLDIPNEKFKIKIYGKNNYKVIIKKKKKYRF